MEEVEDSHLEWTSWELERESERHRHLPCLPAGPPWDRVEGVCRILCTVVRKTKARRMKAER